MGLRIGKPQSVGEADHVGLAGQSRALCCRLDRIENEWKVSAENGNDLTYVTSQ